MFDIPVSNGQLASERLFYTSGDRVGELLAAANSANSRIANNNIGQRYALFTKQCASLTVRQSTQRLLANFSFFGDK